MMLHSFSSLLTCKQKLAILNLFNKSKPKPYKVKKNIITILKTESKNLEIQTHSMRYNLIVGGIRSEGAIENTENVGGCMDDHQH
jgi:hypothetical protein